MNLEIDWGALDAVARAAQTRAYCPYSQFAVGAAALVDDGRIVSGCNSENASYPVGLCAECGLVSQLSLSGGGRIVAFLCYGSPVGAPPTLTVPCGRCRQLLREHAHPEMLVQIPSGIKKFTDILPESFGPEFLPGVQNG